MGARTGDCHLDCALPLGRAALAVPLYVRATLLPRFLEAVLLCVLLYVLPAAQLITEEAALAGLVQEVAVCFGGKLMRGNRCQKVWLALTGRAAVACLRVAGDLKHRGNGVLPGHAFWLGIPTSLLPSLACNPPSLPDSPPSCLLPLPAHFLPRSPPPCRPTAPPTRPLPLPPTPTWPPWAWTWTGTRATCCRWVAGWVGAATSPVAGMEY